MGTTSKRRGFSLMEVLIAMGIAGVGLCGIMTALPVIAFQVQKVRSQVSGDQLAEIARETIRLQEWCNAKKSGALPTDPYVSWATYNAAASSGFEVSVAQPILIDPWSGSDPFLRFTFRGTPLKVGTPLDVQSFFTDPTSLKVSANPGSERPELTYVSLNNSIAPDRNDDYSWFYTVLPKIKTGKSPLVAGGTDYDAADIDSYQVSVVVSRARAFGDFATHRTYVIDTIRPGTRADTVIVYDPGGAEPAIGKYAAVVVQNCTDISQYGSFLCWYKVLMAKATVPVGSLPATRVLLQPITSDSALSLSQLIQPIIPPGTLITADRIIEVKSFSVGP